MRWAALIAHVGKRETCTGFWWDNLRKETTGETQAMMGDNNIVYLQEVGCGGMNWIELVLDRDRWRKLWNAVMKLRVQ
jgi:hypothetical protein